MSVDLLGADPAQAVASRAGQVADHADGGPGDLDGFGVSEAVADPAIVRPARRRGRC